MNKDNIFLTTFVMKIIEKVLNVKFEIKGEENIPKEKPILFCANHFTRFETFVIPYILNKIPNLKYTRSLAYKDLFVGKLGEYLRSVKVISTEDENRDEIIINDLITNAYNWIIYPEGKMMKDKKIFTSRPYFFKKYKMLKTSAKTGVSVLAMKAELMAKQKNEIQICPITISYRPMHAKRNKLYLVIKRFFNFNHLPSHIKEEMYFESSLLSLSTISIQFHKPINVGNFVKKFSLLPENVMLDYLRYPLTTRIMHSIYIKTPLTFDHFFAFLLFYFASLGMNKVDLKLFKEGLFCLIANAVVNSEGLELAQSLKEMQFASLLMNGRICEMFEETAKIMELKELGKVKNNVLEIDIQKFLQKHNDDEIRLKNIFSVLLNEVFYFKNLVAKMETLPLRNLEVLTKENGILAIKLLEMNYEEERKNAKGELKPKEIGLPRFTKSGEVGILFCHGFRASPLEMQELFDFAVKNGFSAYNIRLKGHGTNVEEMKKCKMEDWLFYHKFSFEAFSRLCTKVFVCGFSMGGLISIINSENSNYAGLITISSPLKVEDMRFYFAGIANELSSVLKIFSKDAKEYVKTNPENPDSNYDKNYFSSLDELKKIINLAEEKLSSVSVPALIIQGMSDPTVSPSSGMMIYKGIKSKKKELFEIDLGKKHVIVRGENSSLIAERIMTFVSSA